MATAIGSGTTPSLKDFVFIEKLGSGTYATVYKAYRKGGKREVVAIKCVAKTSLNRLSKENLLTEIELLKKLKHDNIVELKDFQWDQHYIYLIMEYCSGGDLSKYIRAQRKLPELAVKRFIQQLAKALQYMRSENVSHMDLKPQNILLTSTTDPVLKVGDFGFAHYLIGDTEAEMIRGSPLYMAPEIVIRRFYNEKADLWSTGVILYECLFGHAPFASRTLAELKEKIMDNKKVELPYGAHVSDRVRNLLQGLLQRDPEKRMSFEEFLRHPFVDLDHAPSASSLAKAIELSADAVEKDSSGDAQAAIKLYCQSLEHYVPAIRFEKDERKRQILRKKVREYMDRAEQLKNQLKPADDHHHHRSRQKEGANGRQSTVSTDSDDPVDELLTLSEDDAHLNAAIKLIKVAQYKERHEDYDTALEKYEMALGALLQLLKAEPKGGRRREILQAQVPLWMGRAERIKAFLEVRKLNLEKLKELENQQEEDNKASTRRSKMSPFKSVRAWFNKRKGSDVAAAYSVSAVSPSEAAASAPSPATTGTTSHTPPSSAGSTSLTSPSNAVHTSMTSPSNVGSTSVTSPSNAGSTSVTSPSNAGSTSVTSPSNADFTSLTSPSTNGYTSLTSPGNTGFTSLTSPSNADYTSLTSPSNAGFMSLTSPSTTGYTSLTSPGNAVVTLPTSPSNAGMTSLIPNNDATGTKAEVSDVSDMCDYKIINDKVNSDKVNSNKVISDISDQWGQHSSPSNSPPLDVANNCILNNTMLPLSSSLDLLHSPSSGLKEGKIPCLPPEQQQQQCHPDSGLKNGENMVPLLEDGLPATTPAISGVCLPTVTAWGQSAAAPPGGHQPTYREINSFSTELKAGETQDFEMLRPCPQSTSNPTWVDKERDQDIPQDLKVEELEN